MTVESRLKVRIGALIVAAFVVLSFVIGVVSAVAVTLLVLLLWQIYSYSKLIKWWKSESELSQKIIEFASSQLNEGARSRNLWIQSLSVPEIAKTEREYRLELLARPLIIEKREKDFVKAWIEWGGTRLHDCVLRHPVAEMTEDVGIYDRPTPTLLVMVAKAALEITVAEYALKLLKVPNPRQEVSRCTVQKQLEELNLLEPLA